MLLFFVSLFMVFISSYFITSIISEKKSILGFIYLLLIMFANVVLTFELLSLFSAISTAGVLTLNTLFTVISAIVWQKHNRPLWYLDCNEFFKKYFNSLKRDKYLIPLSIGFILFIYFSLYLISFMPVVNVDAGAYHVLRSAFWVSQGSLNHFTIADSRNMILPINSEILYSWVLLFLKKQVWFGIFSFVGFILTIVSIYNILGLMKFGMRRKLWTIFIVSSFSSVIVQASGTETDIIISGLVISSMFLYWYGLKNDKLMPIFMSALAYAIAVGTKTPSLMAVPGVALGMILLSFKYRNKEFYKPFLQFLGFALINFIIFSSYNYVLNFIHYGNPVGNTTFIEVHKNYYGLRAIPANFIKYIFMFFDFTGFKWGDYASAGLTSLRDSILAALSLSDIKDGLYTIPKTINQSLLEPLMGLGILGFLVYLPCWLWSLVKPLFSRKKQAWYLFYFGVLLIINIAIMSYQLMFMVFSIRFLMFFCMLSAPILVYSYSKKNNPYKFVVVLFALFYMILVTSHLWARPYVRINKYIKAGYNITELRDIAACSGFLRSPSLIKNRNYKSVYNNEACIIKDYIVKNINKENKVLFFSNTATDILILKLLDFKGYKIEYGLMEDINNVDLNKYNIILTSLNHQVVTNILHYEERKNDVYVNPETQTTYFRRNADNPCFYLDNKNNIIIDVNNPKINPYLMRCVLTDNFYKKNNFRLLEKYKLELPSTDEKNATIETYYYFYENVNNPIVK